MICAGVMLSRCSLVSEAVRGAPNCVSQGATGAIAQVVLAALRMLRRPNMDRAPGLLDAHFTVTSLLLAHFRLAIVAYGFHVEALGSNLYSCIRALTTATFSPTRKVAQHVTCGNGSHARARYPSRSPLNSPKSASDYLTKPGDRGYDDSSKTAQHGYYRNPEKQFLDGIPSCGEDEHNCEHRLT